MLSGDYLVPSSDVASGGFESNSLEYGKGLYRSYRAPSILIGRDRLGHVRPAEGANHDPLDRRVEP